MKLYVDNAKVYKDVREYCKDKNIQFYSHPLEDEKVQKFVIHGLLADTDLNEINDALKQYELSPVKVANMQQKKQLYDGHATFVIHFKKSDNVTIEKLNQIRTIGYLRIRFQKFLTRNTVAICPKCLNPGHGSSYCGLNPRCVKCGSNHESTICPERLDKNDPRSRIPDEKVKCANCGGNHTANYRGCPKIQQYIEARSNHRRQTASKSRHILPPPLPTMSQLYTHTNNSKDYTRTKSWAHIAASSPNEDDMIPPEQLVQLMKDVYLSLKACRNKSEQISTLFQFFTTLITYDGFP